MDTGNTGGLDGFHGPGLGQEKLPFVRRTAFLSCPSGRTVLGGAVIGKIQACAHARLCQATAQLGEDGPHGIAAGISGSKQLNAHPCRVDVRPNGQRAQCFRRDLQSHHVLPG